MSLAEHEQQLRKPRFFSIGERRGIHCVDQTLGTVVSGLRADDIESYYVLLRKVGRLPKREAEKATQKLVEAHSSSEEVIGHIMMAGGVIERGKRENGSIATIRSVLDNFRTSIHLNPKPIEVINGYQTSVEKAVIVYEAKRT